NCAASSNNVLIAFIFLLLVGLVAALLSNRDLANASALPLTSIAASEKHFSAPCG
ncbi:hypothetical protein AAVH_40256, partial [Aphelenchoides avenae]